MSAHVVPFSVWVPQPIPGALSQYYDYGATTPATLLIDHAAQDISGGLIDFERVIREAKTTHDALAIHAVLQTLTARAIHVEKLALDRADAISGGNAA